MAAPVSTREQPPEDQNGRSQGRGRVLAAAFDEAERLPAHVESRDRALEGVSRGAPPHEIAAVVETDLGLTAAIVRAAGQLPGGAGIRGVADAVERLGPGAVEALLRSAPGYDVLEAGAGAPSAETADRSRLHALLVQRASDRIADVAAAGDRGELALAAILHDVGRFVLAKLHPGYAERFDRRVAAPDERMAAERRELGIDHALAGGVLARRWGVHARVGEAIERHHSEGATGAAGVIRVADMVAAHLDDTPVDLEPMLKAAEAVGLGRDQLREVIYDLPQGTQRRRAAGPCPLSARELDVLRRLAEGKVYKQIAAELELSASTVRSHLHNVYGKLGALDRAQAVLIATDRGWI